MHTHEEAAASTHTDALVWRNYYITKGALTGLGVRRSKYIHTSLEYLSHGRLVSCVLVVDRNGPKSVTNDAERVCRELHAFYETRLLNNHTYRVIYRDSRGEWSELSHQGGNFLGFVNLDGLSTQVLQSVLRSGGVPE